MEKDFDICCGIDVGKWSHHFTAVDRRTGEILLDQKVDQSEAAIRDALSRLVSLGRLLVVVDQPGNMAALLFATADDMGIEKGFMTPKACGSGNRDVWRRFEDRCT